MKKIKFSFDGSNAPVDKPVADANTFVDNSADDLKRARLEMLKQRLQRENTDDPEGMQIQMRDAQPEGGQSAAVPQEKFGKLTAMLDQPIPDGRSMAGQAIDAIPPVKMPQTFAPPSQEELSAASAKHPQPAEGDFESEDEKRQMIASLRKNI
jgi:hypothetical protein